MRPAAPVAALAVAALLAGCVTARLDLAGAAAPVPFACAVAGPACEQALSGPRVNEFSAAANPLDPQNVIVTANDYGAQENPAFRAVNFVWGSWWTTKDGGATWTYQSFEGRLPDLGSSMSGRGFAGDLVVAFGPDGTAYVAGMAYTQVVPGLVYRNAVWVATSADGGDSFSDPVLLPSTASDVVFHDKPAIAIDPEGRVHLAWILWDELGLRGDGPRSTGILYARSDDGGATWGPEVRVSRDSFATSPTLAVGPDGGVNVAWRETDVERPTPATATIGASRVAFARSVDGGDTFGDAREIRALDEREYELPRTSHRAPSLPTMVATADGALVLVTADKSRRADSDVFLLRSTDDGATWTERRLNTDATHAAQFLPTLAVAPDGARLVASWLDRRDDPEDRAYRLYATASPDGGVSWAPEAPVATSPSLDPNPRPRPNPVPGLPVSVYRDPVTFVGDYIGAAVSGDRAYFAWPDLREDGQSHLWAAARSLALA